MANTYDTSMLPIGTSDPRALYNNASNADEAMNTQLMTWTDRFGRARKSWSGFEGDFAAFLAASAFEPVHLTYVVGTPLVVQRPTQFIDYNGSVYRVKMPSTFPVQLTGTWATDVAKLVDVGDASLRQALAAAGGTAMIGGPRGTLEADLLALRTVDTTLQTNIDNAIKKIPPANFAQALFSRAINVFNLGYGVNIIGDSISAGAYQGNAYTNGWPYLLAKAINNQFGAKNIGIIPCDALYNPVDAYKTDHLHTVTWSGNWGTRTDSVSPYNWPLGNTGTAAGDAVNGKTVVSTESGAYMDIVSPAMNPIATIFFVGRPDGGKLGITVNGVAQADLDTYSATKTYNKSQFISTPDNGQGEFNIRITKKDGSPTEIQSVIKYQKTAGDLNDHLRSMNVCNNSISGRQLAAMTEASIIAATNCACMILALGFNDSPANTDDTYYANFLAKVNLIIKYANVQKCLVVVNDFCWYSPPTARVRTQLKRIADETKGIYIPFPDRFYPDGTIVVDTTPNASALISPLQLFADNAHPSYKGNEMIFTQVARALGLGITTKRSALLNDLPYPLKLQGTIKNKPGDQSTVSRVSGGLLYSLGATATGGGAIASGSVQVAALPPRFYPAPLLRASVGALGLTSAGLVNYFTACQTDGSVSATVINASVVEGSFFVAENAS